MKLATKLALGLFFIIVGACGGTNDSTANKKVEFYYYPDLNLYYNVAKSTYFFSLDGGSSWTSLDARTEQLPATLGKKVLIKADTDSIWLQNESHRTMYGGKIYDVVQEEDSNNTKRVTEVTDKVIAKKKTVVQNEGEEEKTRKKGLGRLIDKIFGKKKSKKENNN